MEDDCDTDASTKNNQKYAFVKKTRKGCFFMSISIIQIVLRNR